MPPLIEAKQLSRTFTSGDVVTPALREATLSINSGEFVAIMGASGSGKSTLLHILGLLDRPTSGSYYFAGRATAELTEQQQAHLRNEKIGFVFQAFHLLSRATVLENVMLPLYYSHLPERQHISRAETIIQQLQLDHRSMHLPSQLSGGEKQRVALARALVNQPDVVFADEPTGNLDSRTGQAVMALVDSFHRQGRTIIVITHESAVAAYAQRIITLSDGSIVSDEPNQRSHRHHFIK
jgi:putative ABC transport system ATP-binding protein